MSIAQGQSVAEAIRAIGVTEVTDDRWRRQHGGLKTDQVRRMRGLEGESRRLRKAIADPTLDSPHEIQDTPSSENDSSTSQRRAMPWRQLCRPSVPSKRRNTAL